MTPCRNFSFCCIFVLVNRIPAISVAANSPNNTTQAQIDCILVLEMRPAIEDLFLTLGVGQFNVSGKLRPPTPAQMFNDAYASAKDSGAALAFIDGTIACGGHPSDKVRAIWRGFSAGAFTYGETSLLLFKELSDLEKAGAKHG